jgi:hypothetical protein
MLENLDLRICVHCGQNVQDKFHYGCTENGTAPGSVIDLEEYVETRIESELEERDDNTIELRRALKTQARKIKTLRASIKWLTKGAKSIGN